MRIEGRVFTDKLTALRYNREQSGQFFEATIPGVVGSVFTEDEKNPIKAYVVAISKHRAQIALVEYLMGVTKWSKKKQDDEYIEALEATQEDKEQS